MVRSPAATPGSYTVAARPAVTARPGAGHRGRMTVGQNGHPASPPLSSTRIASKVASVKPPSV